MRNIPFYDEETVRQHLRYETLIPAMRQALVDYSAGTVQQPVRQILRQHGGAMGVMPASGKGLGAKLVTFYPKNAERGMVTHTGLIVLFEPETGVPLCIMDGRLITEMRTAAVSAAATDLCASTGAHILGVLGSGVQAEAHIEAIAHVRRIDEVRVWSRTDAHAERLVDRMRHWAANQSTVPSIVATSAESAVRGAHIVVTATMATQPVLNGDWLSPGAHVNAVGGNLPDWRELDDVAMRNLVFVDSRAGAEKESGDLILSGAEIYAEIGEVFAGLVPSHSQRTTIFNSLGMAIEDVVSGMLVLESIEREDDLPGA